MLQPAYERDRREDEADGTSRSLSSGTSPCAAMPAKSARAASVLNRRRANVSAGVRGEQPNRAAVIGCPGQLQRTEDDVLELRPGVDDATNERVFVRVSITPELRLPWLRTATKMRATWSSLERMREHGGRLDSTPGRYDARGSERKDGDASAKGWNRGADVVDEAWQRQLGGTAAPPGVSAASKTRPGVPSAR
jgi:hypothetical protein